MRYAHTLPKAINRLAVIRFEERGISTAAKLAVNQYCAISNTGYIGIWDTSYNMVNGFESGTPSRKVIYYEILAGDRKIQLLTLAVGGSTGFGLRFIGNEFNKTIMVSHIIFS